MKPEHDRVKNLLLDTVSLLCKNGLPYTHDLRVEGLIGITIDSQEVFIVHLNERFREDGMPVPMHPDTTNSPSEVIVPGLAADSVGAVGKKRPATSTPEGPPARRHHHGNKQSKQGHETEDSNLTGIKGLAQPGCHLNKSKQPSSGVRSGESTQNVTTVVAKDIVKPETSSPCMAQATVEGKSVRMGLQTDSQNSNMQQSMLSQETLLMLNMYGCALYAHHGDGHHGDGHHGDSADHTHSSSSSNASNGNNLKFDRKRRSWTSKDKPYACQIEDCHKSYYYLHDLRRHHKQKHWNVPWKAQFGTEGSIVDEGDLDKLEDSMELDAASDDNEDFEEGEVKRKSPSMQVHQAAWTTPFEHTEAHTVQRLYQNGDSVAVAAENEGQSKDVDFNKNCARRDLAHELNRVKGYLSPLDLRLHNAMTLGQYQPVFSQPQDTWSKLPRSDQVVSAYGESNMNQVCPQTLNTEECVGQENQLAVQEHREQTILNSCQRVLNSAEKPVDATKEAPNDTLEPQAQCFQNMQESHSNAGHKQERRSVETNDSALAQNVCT